MYVTSQLNINDRLLISIRCAFFSGKLSERNLKVKLDWLGAIRLWVTDWKVDPGYARERTKCVVKISVGL